MSQLDLYGFSSRNFQHIILPMGLDTPDNSFSAEVYKKFMAHLREVPIRKPEIKILSSIQFTADMLDLADAHVAKILVDLGLRAPRLAFPAQYLQFADASMMRLGSRIGGPNMALLELRQYWMKYHRESFEENFIPLTNHSDTKHLNDGLMALH